MQRRNNRRAIGGALLLTAFASGLVVLAIKLDWMKLRPAEYHLAGSTVRSFGNNAKDMHDLKSGH